MTARPFLFLSARPEVEAVGPEYTSVLRASGLDEAQLEHVRLDVDPLSTVDLDDYAGVVVGGSPFNVTTPEERKSPVQQRVESDLARLGEWAVAGDRPTLFTCYGIGVFARVLGGEVDTTYGEDADAVEIALTSEGLDDPLLDGLPDRFLALLGHKEAVAKLPTAPSGSRRAPDAPCRSSGSARTCTRRSSTPSSRRATSSPARACTATTATSRRTSTVPWQRACPRHPSTNPSASCAASWNSRPTRRRSAHAATGSGIGNRRCRMMRCTSVHVTVVKR
ncbi:hypothetical protein [Agromyces protaetiae]|uniref:hypothetical protein n=1 Tax=Agromyces protaetiae TaxID=2509455 RepID=UPI001FB65807|nr:hypothetical protein [Agromyces protaetiae]